MVTYMEDCNFPLVLWRTRKSLGVVTAGGCFFNSFVEFQLGRQIQRVLCRKGKPAWAHLLDAHLG